MFWIDLSEASSLVGCDDCNLREIFMDKDSSLDFIRNHRKIEHYDAGRIVPISGLKSDARITQSARIA